MSEGVFINDPEIINFFKTNTDLNIIIEIKKIIRLHKKHNTTKQVTSDEIVSFNTDFESFLDEFSRLKKSYNTHFSKYITEKNPDFKCDICNMFNAINLKGLLIHKRGCLQRMNDRRIPNRRRSTTKKIKDNEESNKTNIKEDMELKEDEGGDINKDDEEYSIEEDSNDDEINEV